MRISDVKTLVQYLDGMKSFYGWKTGDWNTVEANLQHLLSRQEDKRLYLGIVGEFDAGKSTFINALLGVDILKEDILPGTTCASTLLCYGEEFEVEIYSRDTPRVLRYTETFGTLKKTECLPETGTGIKGDLQRQLDEAKMFIHKYTADENFSKSVSKVVISLPCKLPVFEHDVVIVDTPGINAENPRHQEVTEEAVRDFCDLAIVLTPAQAPCSRTLLSFIHENLGSFHKYCICLANQIDRLRKSERARQLKYIEERLHSEEIFFSKVYSASAYYASHPEENGPEADDFRADFARVKTLICDELKSNKEAILSHKVQMLVQHIISTMLTPMLQKTQAEVTERYEELQRNKLTDFDSFLQSEKKRVTAEYKKVDVEEDIRNIVAAAGGKLVKQLYSEIASARTKDQLKALMSQASLQASMRSIQETFLNQEVARLQKSLSSEAKDLFVQFRDRFNSEFRNLGRHTDAVIGNIHESSSDFSIRAGYELNVVASSIEEEGWKKVGAAAVGGIIGSILCPGFGTIGGAIIGGALGSLFDKSLEEYQQQARNMANLASENWIRSLSEQLRSNIVQCYSQNVLEHLTGRITKFSQFKQEVEKIIREEKTQQEKLQCVIRQAKNDLALFQIISENPLFLFQPNSGIEL